MKALLINGSPHANGCTFTALSIVAEELQKNGIETEIVHIGNKDIRGCIACGKCAELGHCVFNDMVNEVAPKFEQADGLVVGSPVYYAGPNGTLTNLLDRLFFSTPFDKRMKVARPSSRHDVVALQPPSTVSTSISPSARCPS